MIFVPSNSGSDKFTLKVTGVADGMYTIVLGRVVGLQAVEVSEFTLPARQGVSEEFSVNTAGGRITVERISASGTETPTLTATMTPTATATATPAATGTTTITQTGTLSVTPTGTPRLTPTITATPTATDIPSAPVGMLLLSPSKCGAATFTGNGELRIESAGLMVNSSCAGALRATGNAKVRAESMAVTGGFTTSGNASFSPSPQTGALPVPDPLASLLAPSGESLPKFAAATCTGNQAKTLVPGIYPKITASGNCTLTLQAGLYVIAGGGMSVSGNAKVTGMGVTLYNSASAFPSPGGQAGALGFTGNGNVNLSAPTVGTYTGVVIFQDRTIAMPMTVSGNASLRGMRGTIYGPLMPVVLSGNGTTAVRLIVDSATISGNGNLIFQSAGPMVAANTASPWALPGPLDGLRSLLTAVASRISG
jgi:hypothetical protein